VDETKEVCVTFQPHIERARVLPQHTKPLIPKQASFVLFVIHHFFMIGWTLANHEVPEKTQHATLLFIMEKHEPVP
jgi:hypothetical protein